MEYVIKRDGSKVKFNESKISNAILKAFKDVDSIITDNAKYIANRIAEDISSDNRSEMSVEDIQDAVIFDLMETNRKDVAKAYCEYRFERQLIRERAINTTDQTILEIADGTNEYWNTENSNKNPRLNTTVRDYMAGETSTDITTRLLLPKDIVEADREGIIHFHDKDYFVQHSHNCFTEYTTFVTKDGIRAFYQYNDGDSVTVLDKNGDWRKATVRKYEDQMMQIVTFTDGENNVNVCCTYDHRWVMLDGSVRTRLNIGDKIALTPEMKIYPNDYQAFIEKEPEIFSLGKDLILENPDKRSDSVRKFITDQEYHNYTDDQKVALIFGILLGYNNEWDFSKSRNSILVYDVEIINIIYGYSVMIGYHALSVEMTVSTTNDGVKRDAWVIQLMKKQDVGNEWTVKNIVPYNNNIRVPSYCVEEPITKSFTLANGIVTGNCDLVNLKDMLMNGTVISEVMIDKPHSFSTACTVATQIIAQVASFQYGGQSISLAHLAPFVDVSRQAFKTEVIFELEDTLFKMVNDINNPLYGRHIPLSKSSDPIWDFTHPDIVTKYYKATGKNCITLNPDGTATKETLLEIAKINIRDVFSDEMIDAMVNDRLKKEISKGIQTIQYQIITLNKIGA